MKMLAQRVAWQWIAAVAVGGASLGLQIALARLIGPIEYGLFTMATSIATIAFVVQGGGYRLLVLRESVRRTEGFPSVPELNAFARGYIAAATAFLVALALAGGRMLIASMSATAAIAIAANAPRLIANLLSAELLARERLSEDARWQMFSRLIPFAAMIAAAAAGSGANGVLFALLAVQTAVLAWRPVGTAGFHIAFGGRRATWAAVHGIVLIDLFTQLYNRQSVFVLYAVHADLADIGRFGLMQRLLESYITLLSPLVTLFGNAVRLQGFRSAVFSRLSANILTTAATLVGMAACAYVLAGPDLLEWLFGFNYRAAAPLAPWLLGAAIFMAPNFMLGQAMIAKNQEWAFAAIVACVTAANALLTWVLASRHGSIGASQAMLATEILLFLLLAGWFWLRRETVDTIATAEFPARSSE
ncbi:hypothetical protein [Terrarubrum flagellatum]|uniref:lipopolysaccharide biosynthesis protein n=1 Tax=Terrirubrum flagellatum TaxID=2895980 RepID=UPI00314552E7